MWTAKSSVPRKQGSIIRIEVHFTDGANDVVEDFEIRSKGEIDDFSRRVDSRRLQIEALYSSADSFVPGDVKFTPPEKSQEELDVEAFSNLCTEYRILKKKFETQTASGIDLGVSQEDLDAAIIQIKASFRPEYQKFIDGLF